MYKQYQFYRRLLMFGDVILTVAVLVALVEIRPMLPGREIHGADPAPGPLVFGMAAFLWHTAFAFAGVYELQRIPNFGQMMGRFTFAHFFAVFTFAGALYFSFRDVSRMLVIYFSATDYVALAAIRLGLSAYLNMRSGGRPNASVLIVGASETGVLVARTILEDHQSVFRVVGFVDEESPHGLPLPAPIVGSFEEAPDIIRDEEIDVVVVALPAGRAPEAEAIIFRLESLPVKVYLVPDMLKLHLVNSDVERFGELVVVGIREPVIQGRRRISKRVLDLLLSVLVLIFTGPLFLLIWVAVRLDSSGRGIFASDRVGENGRVFKMYKFRTMVQGAEKLPPPALSADEKGRPIYKARDDPRVTRVGKFLRRTSLDELPQIFNVLKGDMSLVGPRPEQPFITETYEHWQWRRLSVPPGVTGWWQVSGRSELPMHLNTQYDMYYVRNYSIALDLKILLKTIGVVLKRKGAY
jgi:exopolysaccharide biosynthesis polyprenyl glycosylphosphotransferase